MKRITLFIIVTFFASVTLANGEIASPNMGMPIPTVGVTTGPIYATDINTSLGIIDSHDHSPGNGVPITPAGMNITSDLTCQDNNLTNVKTVRFFPQSAVISGSVPNIGALYEAGVDLYYNDGSGNQVRITQSGSVTGSAGTITGLPSGTAGAAFSAGSGTFTFLQATSTGANMDAGTYILRYPGSYPSPAGNYIALQAPTALATGFALTLPATLPATLGSWMTSDTSGNLSWSGVDNSTLQYSANVVSIKNLGVGTAQIAANAVTRAKEAAVGQQVSSSSGAYTTTSASFTVPTNLSVTITTSGRPVELALQSDGNGTNPSYIGYSAAGAGTRAFGQFYRCASSCGSFPTNYTGLGIQEMIVSGIASANGIGYPPAIFNMIDPVAAGTYTYQFAVEANSNTVNVSYVVESAYEL